MIRRPPRSTHCISSAASDVYKRQILREAQERARAAGARDIEARPVRGDPVHALFHLAKDVNADLLVVGNVGLNTRSDKWLGSVPGNVLRRAKTDVLLVHTTD